MYACVYVSRKVYSKRTCSELILSAVLSFLPLSRSATASRRRVQHPTPTASGYRSFRLPKSSQDDIDTNALTTTTAETETTASKPLVTKSTPVSAAPAVAPLVMVTPRRSLTDTLRLGGGDSAVAVTSVARPSTEAKTQPQSKRSHQPPALSLPLASSLTLQQQELQQQQLAGGKTLTKSSSRTSVRAQTPRKMHRLKKKKKQ